MMKRWPDYYTFRMVKSLFTSSLSAGNNSFLEQAVIKISIKPY
jgi:hypothetical protein